MCLYLTGTLSFSHGFETSIPVKELENRHQFLRNIKNVQLYNCTQYSSHVSLTDCNSLCIWLALLFRQTTTSESLNGSNNKDMGSIAKECVNMQFEGSVSHFWIQTSAKCTMHWSHILSICVLSVNQTYDSNRSYLEL